MNRIKSLFISTIIFLIPAHLVIAQEQKEDLAQQVANLIADNGDYMRGLDGGLTELFCTIGLVAVYLGKTLNNLITITQSPHTVGISQLSPLAEVLHCFS